MALKPLLKYFSSSEVGVFERDLHDVAKRVLKAS
jgi:hypothetical protein